MALEIKQLFEGSSALVSGTKTLDVTTLTNKITGGSGVAYDPAKTMLITSILHTASSPNNWKHDEFLVTGGSDDEFTVRIAGTQTPTFYYQLIEFTSASDITIQHGSTVVNSTSVAVTLSTIVVANAFPRVTFRKSGTILDDDDFCQANITTTTNMELGIRSGTSTVYWQVIESSDFSVTKYSQTMAINNNNYNTSISVDLAKTFCVTTGRQTNGAGCAGKDLYKLEMTSATNLNWWRYETLSPVSWSTISYVVEITGESTVESSNLTFGTGTGEGDDYVTTTVSAGDEDDSIIFPSTIQGGIGITSDGDDAYDDFGFSGFWNTSTDVRVIRDSSTDAGQCFLQVIRIVPPVVGGGGNLVDNNPLFGNKLVGGLLVA